MRRVSPFNPMQSPRNSELKPSYGPGAMHRELEAADSLLTRTGGILPAQRQESSVVAAIRENERLSAASQEEERRRTLQHQRQVQAAQARNVPKSTAVQESQRQQEAYAAGAVSAALYQLEVSYGYGAAPKQEAHPALQSPAPRAAVGSRPAPSPVKPRRETQQFITRAAAPTSGQRSYQKTVHICAYPGCNREARYGHREGSLGWLWTCERHDYR